MANKNANEIVLSYQDCLLRNSDINLLKGPHWLNDTIIGFYFEYLDNHLNSPDKKEILFVSPELTQLLKMTDPMQYDIFLEPIGVHASKFIFFPLNNMDRKDAAGGTHWSLLVYSKPEETCYHFNSSKGYNESVALDFSKKLMLYIHPNSDETFVDIDCPQQDNGYDCGLYVLCFTDIVSRYALENGKVSGCNLDMVNISVRSKRRELLSLIEELKKE
ncbi:hypothetical protein KPH14_011335 [Odynerus spinipes]|uniref:Ubiquitin-like protease family profile domain-containing protein n=1 Tax=Odynerus spinipes TaxID=1348599 RepID=A0AAD9RJQ6_9HYME|nr:hypothetical protein KPH14_011335 [Odynerus spinipes]